MSCVHSSQCIFLANVLGQNLGRNRTAEVAVQHTIQTQSGTGERWTGEPNLATGLVHA